MQEAEDRRAADTDGPPAGVHKTTRPQQGGEAGTTRFGMEEGDNTDVPATGVDPDQQSATQARPGGESPLQE